jgi:hypothetical protein
MTDAVPDGDLFLFGGLIRDIALFGRSGFDSDVDIVVEGDWENCVSYLEAKGAQKNKFGGYRLHIDEWPVDIWSARRTWAVERLHIPYMGVASLLDTTVLNWDAILMNWRTRQFVCRPNYLKELRERILDVVLMENPNPLGMAVRVFRHLCMKDARKITASAARYLAKSTHTYSFDELQQSEIGSYGTTVIQLAAYLFFQELALDDSNDIHREFGFASEVVKLQLGLT